MRMATIFQPFFRRREEEASMTDTSGTPLFDQVAEHFDHPNDEPIVTEESDDDDYDGNGTPNGGQ
jgi:hypothetical protein